MNMNIRKRWASVVSLAMVCFFIVGVIVIKSAPPLMPCPVKLVDGQFAVIATVHLPNGTMQVTSLFKQGGFPCLSQTILRNGKEIEERYFDQSSPHHYVGRVFHNLPGGELIWTEDYRNGKLITHEEIVRNSEGHEEAIKVFVHKNGKLVYLETRYNHRLNTQDYSGYSVYGLTYNVQRFY